MNEVTLSLATPPSLIRDRPTTQWCPSDEVESRIEVARELLSLLGGQVHVIEEELLMSFSDHPCFGGRSVFKEQFILSALGLDSTVQEVPYRSEYDAAGRTSRFPLR